MAKQGALTEPVYYILLSLLTPMHGYGIMQNVKKLTNGRGGEDSVILNVEDFPQGVFVVEVTTKQGRMVRRLVIAK